MIYEKPFCYKTFKFEFNFSDKFENISDNFTIFIFKSFFTLLENVAKPYSLEIGLNFSNNNLIKTENSFENIKNKIIKTENSFKSYHLKKNHSLINYRLYCSNSKEIILDEINFDSVINFINNFKDKTDIDLLYFNSGVFFTSNINFNNGVLFKNEFGNYIIYKNISKNSFLAPQKDFYSYSPFEIEINIDKLLGATLSVIFHWNLYIDYDNSLINNFNKLKNIGWINIF